MGKLSDKNKAIVALVIVAFGYSLLNIAVRLMDVGFGPATQTYLRLFFGSLLTVVTLRRRIRLDKILSISGRDFFLLSLMGTIGYSVGVYFITLGALSAKIFEVSIIYSTIVFFAFIYSFIFLKKKPPQILLLFALISIIGVIFITSKAILPGAISVSRGEVFILLAAASFAFYSVGRKMLSSRLNDAEIAAVVMPIAFLSSYVFALYQNENINLKNFLNIYVLFGLIIGSFFNLLSTYFENFAFKHLDATFGNQILLSENLFALLIGYLLYSETFNYPEIIGAIMILISVYLSNRKVSSQ